MFEKQTISLRSREIDESINILKRADRYKLFKLNVGGFKKVWDITFSLSDLDKILENMPDSEFSQIGVPEINNENLNNLTQIFIDKNRQDLLKVLKYDYFKIKQQSEPFLYIPEIKSPEKYDMSRLTEKAGCI